MSRRDADAYQGKEGPSGEGRVKCAGIGAVRSHAWAGRPARRPPTRRVSYLPSLRLPCSPCLERCNLAASDAAHAPFLPSQTLLDEFRFLLLLPSAPYDTDPAASAAIAATMEKLDWAALLRRVDEGYCSWRQPSLLLFGTSGQWLS